MRTKIFTQFWKLKFDLKSGNIDLDVTAKLISSVTIIGLNFVVLKMCNLWMFHQFL